MTIIIFNVNSLAYYTNVNKQNNDQATFTCVPSDYLVYWTMDWL